MLVSLLAAVISEMESVASTHQTSCRLPGPPQPSGTGNDLLVPVGHELRATVTWETRTERNFYFSREKSCGGRKSAPSFMSAEFNLAVSLPLSLSLLPSFHILCPPPSVSSSIPPSSLFPSLLPFSPLSPP